MKIKRNYIGKNTEENRRLENVSIKDSSVTPEKVYQIKRTDKGIDEKEEQNVCHFASCLSLYLTFNCRNLIL